MDKEREKKKTLTISSNYKKKIDSGSLSKNENKKAYSIPSDKKNLFKASKNFKKTNAFNQNFKNHENKSKKFTRKFVEQEATKAFIKKDEKPTMIISHTQKGYISENLTILDQDHGGKMTPETFKVVLNELNLS